MAGVLNDYNQQEGHPKIKIGNWVEERALMEATGLSRGIATVQSNDTAARVTGPVTYAIDYGTTSNLAHQATFTATAGPNYISSVAPPRRANARDAQRLALAQAIMAERERLQDEQKGVELHYAAFGGKDPQNRKRLLDTQKSLEDSKTHHPLEQQAISFHTHNIKVIHGVTPTDKGVHTFSRNTHFSKPISELHESGER